MFQKVHNSVRQSSCLGPFFPCPTDCILDTNHHNHIHNHDFTNCRLVETIYEINLFIFPTKESESSDVLVNYVEFPNVDNTGMCLIGNSKPTKF